jgi:hypothetical protein
MTRLFPPFPQGRIGAGLLLLRAGIGAIVIGKTVTTLVPGLQGGELAGLVVGACIGALLIVGLLTPVAGAALCASTLFAMRGPSGVGAASDASLLLALVSSALVLVGPGAYSFDARLFGPREIIVPPGPPRPRPVTSLRPPSAVP